MTARFVILSLLQKGEKSTFSIPFSVFCVDTSLSLSMTKQIGMIILGCRLNFLEQMKNLKNLQFF